MLDKAKFDSFFRADIMKFQDNDGRSITRPFVFCSDFVGFIQEIAALRGLDVSDLVLKVGLDGGKGHLKMILTIYDPNMIISI